MPVDAVRTYPEIGPYLDDTDSYEVTASETRIGDDRILVVTQRGIDGQQLYFKWNGEHFEFWDNDTIVDSAASILNLPPASRTLDAATAGMRCGPSSDDEHRLVHEAAVRQVGRFSSASGPDRGNLACVWAVRHLVQSVLGRWITRTDGTAVFAPELLSCFGATHAEAQVKPGSIIISPTQNVPGSSRRNIGHVGIIGDGRGEGRLIYSNSSARAVWEQNFTLGSWIRRYRDTKGLKILFFPLPVKSVQTS
jgi:hypothetical protein